MVTKRAKKNPRKENSILEPQTHFHERFEIEIGIDEAKRRFVNRVRNKIFGQLLGEDKSSYYIIHRETLRDLAHGLGEEYTTIKSFSQYIRDDSQIHGINYGGDVFHKCLHALEVIYKSLSLQDDSTKNMLSVYINTILKDSEIDLGITWKDGAFIRSGAKILDEKLVNESLRWLSDPKYKNVYDPFVKGLSHFLESEKRPEVLSDVITDMYESLEALAKIVTGRHGKDLSANAETFIQKVKASEHYKRMLKEYIAYANEFRHAAGEQRIRPSLSTPEAEFFIYLTGLFIRLVIETAKMSANNAA